MKLEVLKINGKTTGDQVTLDTKVFGIDPNDHAIWLAVTAELANRRQGTSSTKNRSAVRGGGRKPWRQKGRGVARAGTIRSPLWVGGGRIFGPSPRTYKTKLPKKVNLLARKSALSHKVKEGKLSLIEDFSFEQPKTNKMNEILKNLNLDSTKTLLLLSKNDRAIWLSSRNIPNLCVREASSFSTYDVVKADQLIIQKDGLKKLKEVLEK